VGTQQLGQWPIPCDDTSRKVDSDQVHDPAYSCDGGTDLYTDHVVKPSGEHCLVGDGHEQAGDVECLPLDLNCSSLNLGESHAACREKILWAAQRFESKGCEERGDRNGDQVLEQELG